MTDESIVRKLLFFIKFLQFFFKWNNNIFVFLLFFIEWVSINCALIFLLNFQHVNIFLKFFIKRIEKNVLYNKIVIKIITTQKLTINQIYYHVLQINKFSVIYIKLKSK